MFPILLQVFVLPRGCPPLRAIMCDILTSQNGCSEVISMLPTLFGANHPQFWCTCSHNQLKTILNFSEFSEMSFWTKMKLFANTSFFCSEIVLHISFSLAHSKQLTQLKLWCQDVPESIPIALVAKESFVRVVCSCGSARTCEGATRSVICHALASV